MKICISRSFGALFCLGLTLAVAWVYAPVRHFEFLNGDYPVNVTENYHVRTGLPVTGLHWAFTSADVDYWRPVTWLSHMLDCQVFGLNAGAHHVVNALLHLANSLLLFVLLRRMTG